MKLKDIHKTAGQFVQDLAIANASKWQNTRYRKNGNKSKLLESFRWSSSPQHFSFWESVDNMHSEKYLKQQYPEVFKNEPNQEIPEPLEWLEDKCGIGTDYKSGLSITFCARLIKEYVNEFYKN